MDSDHVLVLFLGLVLVGAAIALAYSTPALLGNGSENVSDASLASFETTEPYCGNPDSTSVSVRTQDASIGDALVINEPIPVASNDTTVSASLEEFGPQRYILAVQRETPEATPTPTPTPSTETATATPSTETPTATPGNDTSGESTDTDDSPAETETPTSVETANASGADGNDTAADDANGTATEAASTETGGTETVDTETTENRSTPTPTDEGANCHPTIEYNATIHVTQPEEFTLLITYDGELVGSHWRDGEDTGSFNRVPEQRPTTDGPNETVGESAALARVV